MSSPDKQYKERSSNTNSRKLYFHNYLPSNFLSSGRVLSTDQFVFVDLFFIARWLNIYATILRQVSKHEFFSLLLFNINLATFHSEKAWNPLTCNNVYSRSSDTHNMRHENTTNCSYSQVSCYFPTITEHVQGLYRQQELSW